MVHTDVHQFKKKIPPASSKELFLVLRLAATQDVVTLQLGRQVFNFEISLIYHANLPTESVSLLFWIALDLISFLLAVMKQQGAAASCPYKPKKKMKEKNRKWIRA